MCNKQGNNKCLLKDIKAHNLITQSDDAHVTVLLNSITIVCYN